MRQQYGRSVRAATTFAWKALDRLDVYRDMNTALDTVPIVEIGALNDRS